MCRAQSDKLGEIAPGTLVFVLETRETADSSTRMKFAFATPQGGMSEGGWVTSTTKDGTENVREVDRTKGPLGVLGGTADGGGGANAAGGRGAAHALWPRLGRTHKA